ncbi:hypothetical protein Goari_019248 [Gossypium aridum]|uniref:DUF4283 domain-containing protein n=1 Tax=Gossypium aridum TaxID=34290 RepID=A0A7J8WT77_GOSAI|nr:hypothetical protein [Gossypium aridum]
MEEGIAALTMDEGEEEPGKMNTGDETTPISVEYSLVACFLTATVINFQSTRNTFVNLWHPIGGEGDDPQKLLLFFVNFWVQVHDLPKGLMSEQMVTQFGNFVGRFVGYNAKAGSKGFIRIRIAIDAPSAVEEEKEDFAGLRVSGICLGTFLKAPRWRSSPVTSRWLREEGDVYEEQITGDKDGKGKIIDDYSNSNLINQNVRICGCLNEDKTINIMDGKKRPRMGFEKGTNELGNDQDELMELLLVMEIFIGGIRQP